MRKNSVNKFDISIPNCHIGNELKLEVSGMYSSLYEIFADFPKNLAGQKRASFLEPGVNQMGFSTLY